MFKLKMSASANVREQEAIIQAMNKSQAVIEFNLDGTVITANANFLSTLGYSLPEIQGKHHSMFVDPAYANSGEYRSFWEALRRGEYQTAEYKRLGKGGREVWIQASYNPILDGNGKPYKVIKFATDITQQKLINADFAGQVMAISKSMAVIHFHLDGTIINANQNFLSTLGYSLPEIQGKHHSMFVEPAYANSGEYQHFWEMLRRGEFQSAEYKRIGKGGKEVWIQASYNPIMDASGKVFKVVKFATDVTQQKLRNADYAGQLSAISKAMAVIEFNLDGTILTANQNFLSVLGYSLPEVQGKHHSMFVEAAYGNSTEYRSFWEALRRGEFQSAEYKRIGRGGKEVWIQASYNPILDMNGKPFKVVKYATDITRQVLIRQNNERVKEMMDSTAAGAEELNASVKEIASAMVQSKNTADVAYDQVEAANEATKRLNATAQAMGGIVDMIDSITGQINLLALNATIESARAGDAGKGFAVVANEVKNLAGQAKNANDQIAKEISGLMGISNEVVAKLNTISQSIAGVREYVTSTAAAVEEQSAVANQMSSSMQMASEAARKQLESL